MSSPNTMATKTAWPQLKAMLLSQEFRTPFVRRVLDAFSEKRRVLHVRIPSCAGRHVLELMDGAGPLIPLDVGYQAIRHPDSLGPLSAACSATSTRPGASACRLRRCPPLC